MDRRTVDYLSMLPAVKTVTGQRIFYADRFKRRVAAGCRRGESPVRMFREAGLGPEVIGYKRIERCVARWRSLVPEPTPEPPAGDAEGRLDFHGSAPMSAILSHEVRLEAMERRITRMTRVLHELGVDV